MSEERPNSGWLSWSGLVAAPPRRSIDVPIVSTASPAGDQFQSHTYAAPKLYLNGTRLLTGRKAYTGDFKKLSSFSGQPTIGILGMDYLRHYCLQLDFDDTKMCFLNSDGLDAAQLGESARLVSQEKCFPGSTC